MSEKQLPTLYSLTAIGIATVLGSALAGGYMLYCNYRELGQPRPGLIALAGSLGLIIASLSISVAMQPNPTLTIMLPLIQVMLVVLIAHQAQGRMFRSFEAMGGMYHPLWHTLVIGIVASLVMVVVGTLFFGDAILQTPNNAQGSHTS